MQVSSSSCVSLPAPSTLILPFPLPLLPSSSPPPPLPPPSLPPLLFTLRAFSLCFKKIYHQFHFFFFFMLQNISFLLLSPSIPLPLSFTPSSISNHSSSVSLSISHSPLNPSFGFFPFPRQTRSSQNVSSEVSFLLDLSWIDHLFVASCFPLNLPFLLFLLRRHPPPSPLPSVALQGPLTTLTLLHPPTAPWSSLVPRPRLPDSHTC